MPDFRFFSAVSQATDMADAADQTLGLAANALEGRADCLFAFVSPEHKDSLRQLHILAERKLHARVCVAATAQGVIGREMEIEQGPALSVFAARMPGVAIHPFTFQPDEWPALLGSPELLCKRVAPEQTPKAVLLLPDPFTTPMVPLLPMFDAAWPGVPVFGGMASAAHAPGGNRLMINGEIHHGGTVGVSFAGPLRVDTTVSQGCKPLGKTLVITKSKRNIIMELGGRPALLAIQEMVEALPDADRELLADQPLMVGRVIDPYKERFGRGDFLIRSLMGVDREHGYVAVADPEIRMGQTVQFHVRDQRTAREDFSLLLEVQSLHGMADAGAQGSLGQGACSAGAMLFSCNGRGSHLFDEAGEDARMVAQALGPMPLAGFFAAGEIGPVGKHAFVHGHTASLAVFRAE